MQHRSEPGPPGALSPENEDVAASWLAEHLGESSASEIGMTMSDLITSGTVSPGTRLPTIRTVAKAAGVSVGTIAEAWSILRNAGLIETNRRAGSIVVVPPAERRRAAPFPGWSQVDLVQCYPDPSLQPDLEPAFLASLATPEINARGRSYITEPLRRAASRRMPFEPEAWSTAGGGTEGLLLAISAAAPPGSSVIVDEPASPGLLDMLRVLDITPVGVAADDAGPTPESFREALAAEPAAFLFQPSSAYARFHLTTPERVDELAQILTEHGRDIWVVEDDALGPLAPDDVPSLGSALPGRVIRVQSYCKAFGLDVRTSVLAGPEELIARTIDARSHGVASNSRILQNALAYLIDDEEAARTVRAAWRRYLSRRANLVSALEGQGLRTSTGPNSLMVSVAVRDEVPVLLALASQGIAASSGSKAVVGEPDHPFVRFAIMQLSDESAHTDELARLVGQADRGELRDYFD